MIKAKKNSWFPIAVLVLIALILGEIGFLGYQFWFRCPDKSPEESPVIIPSLPPHPSPSSVTAKPFVQLVFGWLEELSAESLTLTTEDGQKATFPLDETEIFLFEPREVGPVSLFTFLDEDFEKRPEAERIETDRANLGAPAYLVLELTADDFYLGRRLVIVEE